MKENNKYRSELESKDEVELEGIGKLSHGHREAELDEEQKIIKPPKGSIEYSGDSETIDLRNVKDKDLEDLGRFTQDDSGAHFEPTDEEDPFGESYGLPEVHLPETVVSTKKRKKSSGDPKKQNAFLWVGLSVLIFAAVFITYLFLNDDAYELVVGEEAANTEVPATTTPKPTVNETNTATPNEAQPAEVTGAESNEGSSSPTTETPATKKTENAIKTPYVDTPTGQFYVVASSMNSRDNAKKKRDELIVSGYPEAKVVEKDGKYRVTVADYSTRNGAEAARDELRSKFKGVWILQY